MGQTALYEAFAQSDLDMKGFNIINCPSITGGGGVNPNNFPPVANQFINQYNSSTGNFGARRPVLVDANDWPSPVGNAGKFLKVVSAGATPDVATYGWDAPSVTGFSGFINVKDPPYNCVGNGTTDDTAGLQAAIAAAAGPGNPSAAPGPPAPPQGGGKVLYFPKGVYRTTQKLAPSGPISILGDGPYASIIQMDLNVTPAGAVLDLSAASGSTVKDIGFSGSLYKAVSTTPQIPVRHGIFANGANAIVIDNCIVYYCLGVGIAFDFCQLTYVRNCTIAYCGSFGLTGYFCPRMIIRGNTIQNCQESGIAIVNSQQSTITGNQITSCAPYGYGLLAGDSDNSQITGNIVQQCAVGVLLATSATRAQGANWDQLYSYGYTFTGNTVVRNYYGGVQVMWAHGFKITGNVISDNGQGGSDGTKGQTIEWGLMVPIASAGTGYQVGDVVQLDPNNPVGTTNPALAVVTRVATSPSGAIFPEGLMLLATGTYASAWPTDPVNVVGGHGSGAKCIYSGSKIAAAGSGYSVGQAVRHNININGVAYSPVRAIITGVGAGGAVTSYVITDGGGYFNTSYGTLTMVGDAYTPQMGNINGLPGLIVDSGVGTGAGPGSGLDGPDLPDAGSGFILSPNWGLRYSGLYNSGAGTTANLALYHQIRNGVISGNVIDHCLSGCGFLNLGSSGTDRAGNLVMSGNALINNLTALSGGTVATGGVITLDGNYNIGGTSIFQTDVNVGGTHYFSPLNIIAAGPGIFE